jgi:hypothetical protein
MVTLPDSRCCSTSTESSGVGGSGRGEVLRGQIAKSTLRSDAVVLDLPVLDQYPGLQQAAEHLPGEQLVAQPAAELSTYGSCQGEPGSM